MGRIKLILPILPVAILLILFFINAASHLELLGPTSLPLSLIEHLFITIILDPL